MVEIIPKLKHLNQGVSKMRTGDNNLAPEANPKLYIIFSAQMKSAQTIRIKVPSASAAPPVGLSQKPALTTLREEKESLI